MHYQPKVLNYHVSCFDSIESIKILFFFPLYIYNMYIEKKKKRNEREKKEMTQKTREKESCCCIVFNTRRDLNVTIS
jgi:cbb3-type cytochrome oxidase subunit 3